MRINIVMRVYVYYNKGSKGEKILMPMTPKQIIRLLKKNGFVEVRQIGSHKQFKSKINGRMVTVPFHRKDLAIGTEKSILKQAGIKKGGV